MTKFFKLFYSEAILGSFCPNWGRHENFLEKKALPVFKNSNYLPLRKKLEKLVIHSREKLQTERRAGRQTDN